MMYPKVISDNDNALCRAERDLTGRTFGDWTVLRKETEPGANGKRTKWLCVCSCGKQSSVYDHNLVRGLSERCNDWKRHPRQYRTPTSECIVKGDVVEVRCANGVVFMVDFANLNEVSPPSREMVERITDKVNRLFNIGGFSSSEKEEVAA